MAEIDIRLEDEDEVIDTIIFSDESAQRLVCRVNGDNGIVDIIDDEGDFVVLKGKTHAKNLIKALDRAIDLGWFND